MSGEEEVVYSSLTSTPLYYFETTYMVYFEKAYMVSTLEDVQVVPSELGRQQAPWFFLQPSYWRRRAADAESEKLLAHLLSSSTAEKGVAVAISNLRKTYGGADKQVWAGDGGALASGRYSRQPSHLSCCCRVCNVTRRFRGLTQMGPGRGGGAGGGRAGPGDLQGQHHGAAGSQRRREDHHHQHPHRRGIPQICILTGPESPCL